MSLTKRTTLLNKQRFFRDLGYTPHPGQQEIHQSKASRRILSCGVRWGKSIAAAFEALAAAMESKTSSIGWICAPTYDLADKVFREIITIVAARLSHRIVALKENEKRIVLRNMSGGLSEVRAKSADNPTSLLGEGLSWIVVDEAARLKPSIWQSHLSQRLIDKKGWALLISTPRGKGWFYDLFRRGQGQDPDFESWNQPSWSNPHLDAKLIEQERGRLPERVFRQEFGGEFLEGAGAVFRNIRECATGSFSEPVQGERYYAGLDLAKIEDYTVLVIVDRECRVVFADRYHRIDWQQQVARIKAATDRYHRPSVLVDSTGAGEPVYEFLRRAGVRAQGYPFTQRSKAALVDNLAILFEEKRIVLPDYRVWPEAIDELEAFEYAITDAGNIKTGAPAGIHDDVVVAIGLATWPLRTRQQTLTIHNVSRWVR